MSLGEVLGVQSLLRSAAAVVAIVALAPTGLSGQTLAAPVLPPEAELEIAPGETVTLRAHGSVWGRLVVTAAADLVLGVQLGHDTITDLNVFSTQGEGIYDAEHHTFIYLTPIDSVPRFHPDGYSFEWWGTPEWGTYPAISSSSSFALAQGDQAVLLVANNVDGYTIRLTADGGGQSSDPIEWELGPHPDYQLIVPEPAVVGVRTDAGSVTLRDWSLQVQPPPAIVKVRAWTYHFQGPHLNARADHVGIWDEGPDASPLPGASQNGATASGSHAFVTVSAGTTEPRSMRLRRTLLQADAGLGRADFGAAFAVVPYLPAG